MQHTVGHHRQCGILVLLDVIMLNNLKLSRVDSAHLENAKAESTLPLEVFELLKCIANAGEVVFHFIYNDIPRFRDKITTEKFKINFKDIFNESNHSKPLTSCDGLLVVDAHKSGYYYIVNPVTHYWIKFPSPQPEFFYFAARLVFDDTIQQYKVVIWHSKCDEQDQDDNDHVPPVEEHIVGGHFEGESRKCRLGTWGSPFRDNEGVILGAAIGGLGVETNFVVECQPIAHSLAKAIQMGKNLDHFSS
ncbi:hypothetical protein IFM89_029003 [Coptis chinensis]|uniref:Uncharacterized protein n=1 Tax=Coptis chinensis TaxID=261450 RepID=A0A835IGX1_9MAGN|nr:hypothetical protein IFM89_029003 [Coptis chinensis]